MKPCRGLSRWLAVWCALWLVACASVLGIDERELDSSGYPVTGYDGCRPGVSCDDCILPEHATACAGTNDVPGVCERGDLGECTSCVCENCARDVAACEGSRRCLEIWACLSETRCDLLESSDNGCYRADSCRAAIEGNGGLDGTPFEQAVAIRVCAVTSSCLSCLSPEPAPAPACTPDNGCQDCSDCFQQCVCSGDTFSVCQDFCGEDAPPSSCSEADSCQGCTRCFESCVCNGGEFQMCTDGCRPTCTTASECNDCAGCLERCGCLGGTAGDCAALCQNPSPGTCVEAATGVADACTGCASCFAGCTCGGESVDECLSRCDAQPCSCSDKDACTSDFDACLCDDTAASCGAQFYSCSDAPSPCDECACDRCGDKYALCKDTFGCFDALTCMRDSDCQGPDCFTFCGNADADSAAFATAESLWACSQGQSCSCDSNPFCANQCPDFSQNGVTIEACCAEDVPGEPCGLSTRKHFPRGPECVPRDQPNQPDASAESCPPHAAPRGEPYNEACFEGCRRQDGSCGYFDDITGLGCLDPDMFTDTLTLGCALTR